jgi:hypothetical protein
MVFGWFVISCKFKSPMLLNAVDAGCSLATTPLTPKQPCSQATQTHEHHSMQVLFALCSLAADVAPTTPASAIAFDARLAGATAPQQLAHTALPSRVIQAPRGNL